MVVQSINKFSKEKYLASSISFFWEQYTTISWFKNFKIKRIQLASTRTWPINSCWRISVNGCWTIGSKNNLGGCERRGEREEKKTRYFGVLQKQKKNSRNNFRNYLFVTHSLKAALHRFHKSIFSLFTSLASWSLEKGEKENAERKKKERKKRGIWDYLIPKV